MRTDAVAGETARLELEPLRASHAAEMFRLLADPELHTFLPRPPPVSEAALRVEYAELELHVSANSHERWHNWAVRRLTDGVCVGRVEATACEEGDVWVAYIIGTAFWGQGLATEAMRRLVAQLLDNPTAQRLLAVVDTRNDASMRVLDKLGFVRNGAPRPGTLHTGEASEDWEYVLKRG